MKERMLTASVELDRKVLQEFGYCAGSRFLRGLLLAAIPLIVFFLAVSPAYYRMLFCVCFLAVCLLGAVRNYRSYNRNLDQNGGKPIFNSIVITGSGIRITNPMKEKAEDLPYCRIIGAWRSKNLLYLMLGKKEGRRIAVLGDMLELGDRTQAEHYRIGRIAAEKADLVFAYGPNSKRILSGAVTGGMTEPRAQAFEDRDICAAALRRAARPGDTILFKGSRGMHMELILEAFLAE